MPPTGPHGFPRVLHSTGQYGHENMPQVTLRVLHRAFITLPAAPQPGLTRNQRSGQLPKGTFPTTGQVGERLGDPFWGQLSVSTRKSGLALSTLHNPALALLSTFHNSWLSVYLLQCSTRSLSTFHNSEGPCLHSKTLGWLSVYLHSMTVGWRSIYTP